MNTENNVKESKSKKVKKPITLKSIIIKRIIFILIFLLISIGITTYFIITHSTKENISTDKTSTLDNELTQKNNRNHTSVLNYDTDTFDYNELHISKVYENYDGYDITYFQIDGLINTSVQNKINKNLKEDLEKAIDEAKENNNIRGEFNTWSYTASNFANTISIVYELSSYIYNERTGETTYSWNHYVTENYDLNNGNKIQLQDLFTKDTLGSDIFNGSFYEELIPSYTDQDISENEWDFIVTNYNDIEEEILRFITDFNNGKDIPFYFDEQTAVLAGYYARIFYDEHLEFLALYNNFKSSKSLFTGEYEALKNLPVLTKRYPTYYQIIDEGENYYIDISLDGFYEEYDLEIHNRLLECAKIRLEEDIEQMKQEAKESGKFIIFNCVYYINEYWYWDYNINDTISDGTYELTINKAKTETTKSLFKAEIKNKILTEFREAERIGEGEAKLYNNQFYYYIFDGDYEELEKVWNFEETNLYMDFLGNIFETNQEAQNTIYWGTDD